MVAKIKFQALALFVLFCGTVFGYTAGDGTGLKLLVTGAANDSQYHPQTLRQFTICETQMVEKINVNLSTSNPFLSGADVVPYLAYRGTIIVPETSDYTFNFNVGSGVNGVRMVIGNTVLVSLNRAAYSASTGNLTLSPISLAAGEYPISIDVVARSKGWCKLQWKNSASQTSYQVIPKTQFRPAADTDLPRLVFDGYHMGLTGCFYRPFPQAGSNGDGTFWMSGGVGSNSGDSNGFTSQTFGKEVSGPFVAEVSVDVADFPASTIAGRYLYVGNPDLPVSWQTWKFDRAANGKTYLKSQGSTPADVEAGSGNRGAGSNKQWEITDAAKLTLRLARDTSGTISASYRPEGSEEWITMVAFDANGAQCAGSVVLPSRSTLPDEVYVGVGSSAEELQQIKGFRLYKPAGAPGVFEVVRDEIAAGATLSWSDASGQVAFKVQYRPSGAAEWMTAATLGPDASSYHLQDGIQMNQTYEVRVATVDADGNELPTEIKAFTCGGGFGINAAIIGPIETETWKVQSLDQSTVRETRAFLSPRINTSGSVFSSTNLASAVVIWRGSLTIPVSGEYSFRSDVGFLGDGMRVALGGQVFVNTVASVNALTNKLSSSHFNVVLEAGTYPIEIDYLSRSTGVRKFQLMWKRPGDTDYSEVPEMYYSPTVAIDALPYLVFDGFNLCFQAVRAGSSGTTCAVPWVNRLSAGTYEVRGSGSTLNGYMTPQFAKFAKGAFTADMTLLAADQPSAALFVRDKAHTENFLAFDCSFGTSSATLSVWTSTEPNNVNCTRLKNQRLDAKPDEIRLRICRGNDKTLLLQFKSKKDGVWGEWTDFLCYELGTTYGGIEYASLTSAELYAGVAPSSAETSVVRNLTVAARSGLVILLK